MTNNFNIITPPSQNHKSIVVLNEETEIIAQLYRNGLSVMQIANTFNRSAEWVKLRLRKECVQMRSVSEGLRLVKCVEQIPMTNSLQELLDGCLLGDGCITADSRFALGQSYDHKEWVFDLHRDLIKLGMQSKISEKPKSMTRIAGVWFNQQATVSVRTRRYECLSLQRDRWYSEISPEIIQKNVPRDVILSPSSIANWCCGDGYRGGGGYHFTFCTDGFTENDCQFLIERLFDLYGWRLIFNPSRGRISITKNQDRHDFKKLIEPLVNDIFRYKFNLKINERKLPENKEKERQIKLAKRREQYHQSKSK